MHNFYALLGNIRCQIGRAHFYDLEFALERGVIHIQIKCAALEGFAQLAGVIAGQHHHGLMNSFDGAQLRHADLEVAEDFEQKRLELGIGAVNLVNQQNDRLLVHQCFEQWSRQQETFAEEHVLFLAQPIGSGGQCRRFAHHLVQLVAQQLRVKHLLAVFPFVESFGFVQPFIALQAD